MTTHSRRAVLAAAALTPVLALLPKETKAERPTYTRRFTTGPFFVIDHTDWDVRYSEYGWIWREESMALLHADNPALMDWAYENTIALSIEGFEHRMIPFDRIAPGYFHVAADAHVWPWIAEGRNPFLVRQSP